MNPEDGVDSFSTTEDVNVDCSLFFLCVCYSVPVCVCGNNEVIY